HGSPFKTYQKKMKYGWLAQENGMIIVAIQLSVQFAQRAILAVALGKFKLFQKELFFIRSCGNVRLIFNTCWEGYAISQGGRPPA
ncbi:MAG: hypothetical protein AAB069_01130, partial [Planctomycetota bacterium]